MRKRFETYQLSLPSGLSTVLNMRSSANSKSVCLGTLLDILLPRKKRTSWETVERWNSRPVGGSKISVAGFQPSAEVSWPICDLSGTEKRKPNGAVRSSFCLYVKRSLWMHKLEANRFTLQFLNQLWTLPTSSRSTVFQVNNTFLWKPNVDFWRHTPNPRNCCFVCKTLQILNVLFEFFETNPQKPILKWCHLQILTALKRPNVASVSCLC